MLVDVEEICKYHNANTETFSLIIIVIIIIIIIIIIIYYFLGEGEELNYNYSWSLPWKNNSARFSYFSLMVQNHIVPNNM